MIADKQLKAFIGHTEDLFIKSQTLLDETDERLNSVIDISQSLQLKLEPLSRNIEQYQNAIRNMDICRNELLKTQNFNRTGLEVGAVINGHPSGNLDQYLSAMEKVKTAMLFFKENDPNNVECSHLDALYSSGKSAIEKEFEGILNQAFPILRPENIFNTLFYSQGDNESVSSSHTVNLDIFDNVADTHITDLKILSKWLLEDKAINCVVKYCACRRDALRTTMDRFKEWCRNGTTIDTWNFGLRGRSATGKTTKRKPISKKNVIMVKEGTHKRQGSENKDEFEERETILFTVMLVVLVKLIQNEKKWLEKLNITSNMKEKCGAIDAILKGSINDFLNDGSELVKMMNRAQAKHQYHHVINLIIVLEKFVEVKGELQDILQVTMDATRAQFYTLLNRLTQQIYQCIEVYIEYIKTERVTGINGLLIPEDATVHELTTSSLRFLETLLTHANVTEQILSNINIADKIIPSGKSVSGQTSHSSKSSISNFSGDSGPKSALIDYINKVVEALITNITSMSMSYNDEIARIIFQINNLHYIYKTVGEQDFYSNCQVINNDLSKMVYQDVNNKKMLYIATFIKATNIPDQNAHSSAALLGNRIDNSMKAHIKDIWTSFNESFKSVVKSHRRYALPDSDLRKSLISGLKASFVPKYSTFRDSYMAVSFTTKRDKYIIFSKEDIEKHLDSFFSQ